MRILLTIVFLWHLTSCSPTKTVYVSCTDSECPYCIGTGIRSECNACNNAGHNRDLINTNGDPVCTKCHGYGVVRCGQYIEIQRKKRKRG
jgi:RecJ-like exonuclease